MIVMAVVTSQPSTLDMSAAGAATFNAGITTGGSIIAGANIFRGNMQIESNEIDVSSGNLTLDVAGDIILDADGGNLKFADGGTVKLDIYEYNSNLYIDNQVSDSDIIFQGVDGSTSISALTLDMSAAGAATFNSNVILPDNSYFLFGDTTSGIQGNSSSDFIKFYTANTSRFQIASDGSLFTPTAGTSNVRFGANAGNSIASGGTYNVVVGDEAGTAITTGDENVAVGFEALKAEDTTKGATAIGYRALLQQNLGSDGYNVAVGHSAGISNTTGTANTFIGGFSAGSSTVTGGDNTAVGRNSLFALTSGVQNTIVGSNAGDALTTGGENVAIGMLALTAEDTGRKNVAIGTQALLTQNADVDNYNTAVGYFAGKAVTTGVQNTFIGALSGDAITDADYNVGVGIGTLGANVLGSKSTAVGTNALFSQKPVDASGNDEATDMFNTATGYHAGFAVTTGTRDTLIGGLAGDALTIGSFNVALGYTSLGATTEGNSNVAVGDASLSTNITGSENTAVGQGALSSTTASNNTAVGKSAGDSLTTGSQNTIIGAGADAYAVDTVRTITIGYNTIGVQAGDGGVSDIATIGTSNGSDRIFNEFDTNATWTRVSDERYKEEIQDNNDCGLDFINDLRPVTFKWKPKSEIPNTFPDYDETATTRKKDKKMYGLIAQEVKASLDKFNITEFGGWETIDGEIQAIGQSMFVYPLIKAIQEQQALIESLTARIETLEG
jgi:hypothetical protein